MDSRDRIKVFKRAVARHGLYGSTKLIRYFPYWAARLLGHVLIFIGFRFVIKQKKIARESLNIAFCGKLSEKEIRRIIKDCFENVGWCILELIYFMEHPWMIKERVSFTGLEHLTKAFEQGKGVIAVSAHFGNFPLMLLRFAQEHKTNAIIRPARDADLESYFLKKRSELGLNTIYALPRKECVATSIRVLRNNEMLFIPLDQNFGSGGGVFVEFFGQQAATATGPVVFALRTGAPILPMFIVREQGDRHRIIIEPPLELEKFEDDQQTLRVNITKITDLIEKYVRRYPHEWGWMHRRWKSRPNHERE
jgi:KDO2-lipid IV(A) lauroyltransferase